jgi:hypothetical protein
MICFNLLQTLFGLVDQLPLEGLQRMGIFGALFLQTIALYLDRWPMDTNLFDDPARRRFWLLTKALEDAPLDVALALARRAEAFVTGCADASQQRAVASCLTALQPPTWMH